MRQLRRHKTLKKSGLVNTGEKTHFEKYKNTDHNNNNHNNNHNKIELNPQ